MYTPAQKAVLRTFWLAAKNASHVWPAAAACEAALESTYGTSGLFLKANNAFGTKQHEHPIFGTLNLPTKEFLHHQWVVVNAAWVAYPTLTDAFVDRMDTIKRLAPQYPHYAAALAAKTPEQYLTEVSQTWSTGPDRAKLCIQILHANADCFA